MGYLSAQSFDDGVTKTLNSLSSATLSIASCIPLFVALQSAVFAELHSIRFGVQVSLLID